MRQRIAPSRGEIFLNKVCEYKVDSEASFSKRLFESISLQNIVCNKLLQSGWQHLIMFAKLLLRNGIVR